MNPALITWRRRHKRMSRRLWREIRLFLPMIGVLFCFASSATVIVAAEMVPLRSLPFDSLPLEQLRPGPKPEPQLVAYSTISINSTSKASAAPAGILPVLRLP